jgi:two-component system cell cycle response regulator CtrA
MRVLVIEDDKHVGQSIALMLKSVQIKCFRTEMGEDGVELGKLYSYDLIILDLNLPDISGFEVLRQLRNAKIKTPVLILSGMSSIETVVKGLGCGADDYLSKPFNQAELIARIHAIVRRSHGHAESVIAVDDLKVYLESKRAEIMGLPVNLTGKEYAILELLAIRKGQTIGKDTILNHLYGGLDEPLMKIVDVFICKLRRKLTKYSGGKNYIETIWGRGYALKKPGTFSQNLGARGSNRNEDGDALAKSA